MSTDRSETDPIRLAVIIGSTREGRVGPSIARWFAARAQRHGAFALDMIDLAETPLPERLHEPSGHGLEEWTARIGRADAFVVVTPEYNRGYPASLKHAIDLVVEEWHAKPVGFVTYGGVGRGLRAAEQLRQVFAELHVVALRDAVSLNRFGGDVDENGWVCDHTGAPQAATTLLTRLEWWARALRAARRDAAYSA